jgi:hypothetical protein
MMTTARVMNSAAFARPSSPCTHEAHATRTGAPRAYSGTLFSTYTAAIRLPPSGNGPNHFS